MTGEIWQLVDSSTVGGIETHIAVLARALMADGLPVRVMRLADHGPNPWLRQLEAAGVPHGVIGGGFAALLRRLRQERPALVHTHGYKAGIFGRLAARAAGIACVSTFHAGERGPFPVSAYQALDGLTSCLGPRIAVSPAIATALPFKATVISNFVPVPQVAPESPRPPVVGFVGRFSIEKGPDLFCALAERMVGRGVAFEAFGDGALRPELEARYGGVVRFHGLVAEPAGIWPRIGLLLMPSRAEGLPLAAIEAMAAGIPVAASAVGGLPHLISAGRNGWLFPAGDLDAMAATVAGWHDLTPEARTAMGEAAWRTAREGYAVDVLVPQVRAVYAAAGAQRA